MRRASVVVEDHPSLDRSKRRMAVVVADVVSELTPTEILRALLGMDEPTIVTFGHLARAQLSVRENCAGPCSWCASQQHEVVNCPSLRIDLR